MSETTISLPFGTGVDTKSDPKMTAPPKLNLLKDCIFTNSKRLTKRNGYDAFTKSLVGGSTWSNPTMSSSYRNELVIAATTSSGQRLLSYSENLTAWSDRGKYLSVSVEKQEIVSRNPIGANASNGTINPSLAVSGNTQLYSYTFQGFVYIAVIDSVTGMHLESTTNYQLAGGNTASLPKSILIGASTLGVLYIDGSSGALVLQIITVTGAGGVSVGAPVTIGGSVNNFAAANTSLGAVISYWNSAGTLRMATIDTAGATTHTATVAAAGSPRPIFLNVASNGNIWVYWADGASLSSEPLYYAVFSSVLASVLGKTTIATGLNHVTQITSLATSATQQTLYYSTYDSTGYIPSINSVTVTAGGSVGSPAVYLYNLDIRSNVTTINSVNYMAVVFASNTAPTGFLIDLSDGMAVAKFLPNQADGIVVGTFSASSPGFINDLIQLSSSKILLCTRIVSSLFLQTNDVTTTGVVESANAATMSTVSITFDFSHQDSYQSLTHQDSLVLNGGFLYQYDGSAVSELGFSIDPEITEAVTSGSGGILGAGNWLFYVTYEWTDSNGNLHQSAPSIPFRVVFASGTTNSVSLRTKNLTVSQKTGVTLVLWRTISNGTIAYRDNAVFNSTSASTTDIIGGVFSDTNIQSNPPLYTQGGAILENIAPPPAMILWTNNNRVWCIDSENPETTIEYSKTASSGTGISFSTGLLETLVDSRFGAITAGIAMDEKTVILKQNGLIYFIGDGANDSGSGATITNPQFVPSDVGCSNSKSVVLFPGGVLFRASSDKGIYLFSRGVQVQYFGYDVEAYNSQNIRAAQIVADRNQIRFLTSSGDSILYDYVMNQWSVFTNHAGLSSTTYNGLYVYVRSDGNLYKENRTTFLDVASAISPYVLWSWIKAGSIQGFQRCRRLALLGDFQTANGGHGVQISVAYDFQTTFSAAVPYYFSGSNGAFQYRERLSRQKCDSFQILIQEITTGASGEFIDFSDLGLELMLKKGLNKMAGSASVG